MNNKVAILIGSDTDRETMESANKYYEYFNIDFEIKVLSAHRNPLEVHEFCTTASLNGYRIIVGADNTESMDKMKELYSPFTLNHDRFIGMDIRSAEMTKYVANAMLATRVSFMNEIALLSEKLGADINMIKLGIGSDSRIGSKFLNAGMGYGGSCFPKDLSGLIYSSKQLGINLNLIEAVQKDPIPQVGIHFMKFCGKYDLEKMSQQPNDYAQFLNKVYVA